MPHSIAGTNPTITATQPDSPRAWWACALAVVALFIAFGLAYSYGVFFSAIADDFGTGRGGAAALFSITSLLLYSLGALTGPLSDRYGPRPLLITGGLLASTGLFATAQATSINQAYLEYGLGLGLGAGCVYVPVVSAIGRWFVRYRAIALGIAVSGIGLGTLVVAPVSEWLITCLGWREVYVLYAGIAGIVLVLIGLLFPKPPMHHANPADDMSHPNGRLFARLYGATVLLNVVLYVPFVLLPQSATNSGIKSIDAASLVGVVGLTSVAGRLAIGALGNRYDTMTIYRVCCGLIAASYVVWALAEHYATYLVFSVLIGIGYGGYIVLTPSILAELFGTRALGQRLGLLYTAVGIGAFIGPLGTGWAIDSFGSETGPLMTLAVIGGMAWWAMGSVRRV